PLVVLNPRAAGGRCGRSFAGVRAVLERSLGPVDMRATAHAGHAISLAREGVRGGHRLVIAVGGDGTLNEVANGVLEAGGDAAVAYIGQGTGGDFRRSVGMTHRLDAYVGAIASGSERRVDAGRLTYRDARGAPCTRWFVNILSAGMGGLVDRYVADTTKVFGGAAAYLWASARALANCQRARLRCRVTLAGEERVQSIDTFLIAVCNGGFFGGVMQVAPMAKPDDGRFEVVSLDAPSKAAFAAFSRRIYDGKHLDAPGVQHFGCDRIVIDLEEERARGVFLLDVDGEPLGGLPVEVVLEPGALRLRG
ncbi:MAG: diacylglycerol kinase family lipid kinase, partial [Myxococcota bacterium]|nr:diacylglycerol kinase family lipid kinase [Myxococcota bacterium]